MHTIDDDEYAKLDLHWFAVKTSISSIQDIRSINHSTFDFFGKLNQSKKNGIPFNASDYYYSIVDD